MIMIVLIYPPPNLSLLSASGMVLHSLCLCHSLANSYGLSVAWEICVCFIPILGLDIACVFMTLLVPLPFIGNFS